MLKNIWQKIRQNHLLLMVICCLIPVILIIGFLSLYKGSSNYWFWLIVLLCPLLHILMMRGHDQGLFKCSECGLKYKEKDWAEKCGVWCKEHKSCNLEIIKYAINKGQEKEVIKN